MNLLVKKEMFFKLGQIVISFILMKFKKTKSQIIL